MTMIIKKTYRIPINPKTTPFESYSLTNFVSFSSDKYPNIFSIVHETHYEYTQTIVSSKHLYRLQPLQDTEQTLLNYQFSISANGQVCNFTGAFGNHASLLLINEPYQKLTVLTESIVAISDVPSNNEGADVALIHQPRTLPLIWMPWDRVMLQAYLQPPELPESELFCLAEYAMEFARKNDHDAIRVIEDINHTIYREYTYSPGFTNLLTTPYQVFIHQKGVCQDFAHLLICLARLLSIPARYRVGYVYTGEDDNNKIQSDASHAWVEVYLPYIGWVGYDPTNGCKVGKNHIKVACGRNYSDATPTSGTIFESSDDVEESLSTSVKVVLLNSFE